MRLYLRVFLALTTALAALVPGHAFAQDTPPDGVVVTSAQISGLDLSRLSPGLQADITKVTGSALDRARLRELAARIEAEQPRFVAAVRVAPDPDGGARVVFVAARMRDQELAANVNDRYVVERVEFRGVRGDALTREMLDDRQALLGKPLDTDLVERLETRLRAAFPDHSIERRTDRGGRQGQIRVIFQLTRTELSRWLRFEPLEAHALFHSKQGWGAKMPLTASGGDFQIVPHFAIDAGDDLIEEYSGAGVRFESRKIGTERLGVFFDWSSFNQSWRDETVAALALQPQVPALYRNRMSVTPLVKFAVTPQLSVAGGVSISELDDLDENSSGARMANVALAAIRFDQRWDRASGVDHFLDASFTLRAATSALESDFDYQRYVGQASYLARTRTHRVLITAAVGHIDGAAPLFERFSLGDSQTLRGWNKFAIAPLGGDRMFYASTEYRYRGLTVFLDSGSIWDAGLEKQLRFSSGFGVVRGPIFATIGFPLNTSEFGATFAMGVRFATVPLALGFRKF